MGCFHLEKLFLVCDNSTSHHECRRYQECTFNTASYQVLQLLFYQTCFLFWYQSVTSGLRKWFGMDKKRVFSLPPSLYGCCSLCCVINVYSDWSSHLILLGPCDWCWPELVRLIFSCLNWCATALIATITIEKKVTIESCCQESSRTNTLFKLWTCGHSISLL